MNLALFLLILSVFTGVIYLLDVLFWSKKRSSRQKPRRIIEYSRSLFPIFFGVLLVRSFLFEPFRIPSGSLEPTLLVGDFLVVNKFAYGLRLPVWDKKIVNISSPKRGDIVVFRWPPNPKYDFIKRVIGIPGDVVSYHHKILTINGKKAPQDFIQYTIDESSAHPVSEYQENLDSVIHKIYRRSDVPGTDFEITVPPNQYFVMGDNRDDSADSRYWGFVHDDYLRGKAIFTWLSWNKKEWNIRWSRLGRLIH
ncbi:MAG: signal peptidase I [Legionellales bacterium]|jgi:signal peptidase I|nr:signal peptidase I [Legionellales bacterium]